MTTSEPTTGEIVENLKNAFIHLPTWRTVLDRAIRHIESQEQKITALLELVCNKDNEIEDLREENEYIRDASNVLHGANEEKHRELVRIADELTALTARAEKAEARIVKLNKLTSCEGCKDQAEIYDGDNLCYDCARYEERPDRYTRRGLPQEGDGK